MTGPVCRIVGLAAVVVLASGLAACGGDDDDLPPPASPGADADPSASILDPEHQEILDVYRGSVDAMVAAQQAGDPDAPALTQYFLESTQAHLNVQSTIQRNDNRGMYYTGALEVVEAEVTEVDLDGSPPAATIDACLDYTTYQLVYREDDSPVPDAETFDQVPVTAQAVLGTDDRWYIATTTAHWDEPC